MEIDREHPWPGLESFGESDEEFFFGRDAEIKELALRVRRNLLTLLFSQSGMGKTSLLRAGLSPVLGREEFQPIYIRLDFVSEELSLVDQVWDKLEEFYEIPREDLRPSLWEWFHDTEEGHPAGEEGSKLPVFIFDQFEELFTLGRSRLEEGEVREFVTEIGDLAENRIPDLFEDKLEETGVDPARFDFSSGHYRILVALREDYLSELEREKENFPSVMRNRVMLERLTGESAVLAVAEPAPHLLDDAMAEEIVRWFAPGKGDGNLREIPIEPSLLSLICQELNRRRLDRGEERMTPELLASLKPG